MKMNKLIFVLPVVLASLAACNNQNSNSIAEPPSSRELLDSLLKGCSLGVEGSIDVIYPEGYTYLNYSQEIRSLKDYGALEDGTPATRSYSAENVFRTFIQGKDGRTQYQVLTSDNQVTTVDFEVNYMPILYSEYYGNPFNLVDYSDISEDYKLTSQIATRFVYTLTGESLNVKEAKFTFTEGKVDGIELTISDKKYGIETPTGLQQVTYRYNLDISLSTEVAPFTSLTPRELADENIEKACKTPTNYTIKASSKSFEDAVTYFITEEYVYVHKSIHATGPLAGDVIYKLNDGKYDAYNYKVNSNKFVLSKNNIDPSEVIPNTSNVSANIFTKTSEKHYYLDREGATLNAEHFLVPELNYYPEDGIKAFVTLDSNNNISSFSAMVRNNNPITIDQIYSDYGTTEMPVWFSADRLEI